MTEQIALLRPMRPGGRWDRHSQYTEQRKGTRFHSCALVGAPAPQPGRGRAPRFCSSIRSTARPAVPGPRPPPANAATCERARIGISDPAEPTMKRPHQLPQPSPGDPASNYEAGTVPAELSLPAAPFTHFISLLQPWKGRAGAAGPPKGRV